MARGCGLYDAIKGVAKHEKRSFGYLAGDPYPSLVSDVQSVGYPLVIPGNCATGFVGCIFHGHRPAGFSLSLSSQEEAIQSESDRLGAIRVGFLVRVGVRMRSKKVARLSAGVYVALALTAVLVAYVGGVTNPFTVWNLVPLVVAAAVKYCALPTSLAAIGFALLTCTVVVVAHLAWLFDWGSTATGSSTAGLMFVTLPVLALLAGGVGWLTGWMMGRIVLRTRHDRDAG